MFSFYILLLIITLIIMIYFLPITIKISFNNSGKNFILDIYIYMLHFFKIGYYDMYYKRVGEDDRIEMSLRLFGMKLFSMVVDVANLIMKDKKPVIEYKISKVFLKFFKNKHEEKLFSFHDLFRVANSFYTNREAIYKASLNIRKSIVIRKFNLNMTEGFNDAALTSIFYGIINSIIYTIIVPVYCSIKFKDEPVISIKPYYGRNILESNFNCILDFRYGNIIVNSINFIKNFRRWSG